MQPGHADFDCAHRQVGQDSVNLGGNEFRRNPMNGADAHRVLRGQRGNNRGAIDAKRGEGLQISLDAGSAGRIRAC